MKVHYVDFFVQIIFCAFNQIFKHRIYLSRVAMIMMRARWDSIKMSVLKFWEKVPWWASSLKLYLRRVVDTTESRTYVTIIMGGRIRRTVGLRDKTGWSDFIQFVEGPETLLRGDLVDLAEIFYDNPQRLWIQEKGDHRIA